MCDNKISHKEYSIIVFTLNWFLHNSSQWLIRKFIKIFDSKLIMSNKMSS